MATALASLVFLAACPAEVTVADSGSGESTSAGPSKNREIDRCVGGCEAWVDRCGGPGFITLEICHRRCVDFPGDGCEGAWRTYMACYADNTAGSICDRSLCGEEDADLHRCISERGILLGEEEEDEH